MELHLGCKVVIMAEKIGVLDPEATRPAFHLDVVMTKGDTATYNGPADNMKPEEDWHIVTYWVGNQPYDAPVHRDMIELACEDCEEKPARFSVAEDDADEESGMAHLCRDCVAAR